MSGIGVREDFREFKSKWGSPDREGVRDRERRGGRGLRWNFDGA